MDKAKDMTKSYEILQAIYDKVFENTIYKDSYNETISEIASQSIDVEKETITVTLANGKEYVIRIIASYSPQ